MKIQGTFGREIQATSRAGVPSGRLDFDKVGNVTVTVHQGPERVGLRTERTPGRIVKAFEPGQRHDLKHQRNS